MKIDCMCFLSLSNICLESENVEARLARSSIDIGPIGHTPFARNISDTRSGELTWALFGRFTLNSAFQIELEARS
jgi:hypothetical protein